MPAPRRLLFPLSLLALAAGLLWLGRAMRPSAPSTQPRPEMRTSGIPEPAGGPSRMSPPPSAGPEGVFVVPAAPPAPPPKPFAASDPVLRAVADPGVSLPARFDAGARLLSQPLPPSVLAETIAFLGSPVPDDAAALERERALRNGVLNGLRAHSGHAAALVPALAVQAADDAQDPGLRDYALQHLAAWVPALDETGRAQAIPALQTALQERTGTYAGTALLGLNDLAKRGFLPEPFDAAAEARRLALDDGVSVLSRLTALALVVESGVVEDDEDLTDLARRWSEPRSRVPEGARRTAQAYLKRQDLLN